MAWHIYRGLQGGESSPQANDSHWRESFISKEGMQYWKAPTVNVSRSCLIIDLLYSPLAGMEITDEDPRFLWVFMKDAVSQRWAAIWPGGFDLPLFYLGSVAVEGWAGWGCRECRCLGHRWEQNQVLCKGRKTRNWWVCQTQCSHGEQGFGAT